MQMLARVLALTALAAALLTGGGAADTGADRYAGRLQNPPICC